MGHSFTTYTKQVQEPYFSLIKEKKKTIEGRLYRDDWRKIKVGDALRLTNPKTQEEILCQITKLILVKTFKDLYLQCGKSLLPDTTEDEEPWKIYRKFFTAEDELKYGVIGIKLEVIA